MTNPAQAQPPKQTEITVASREETARSILGLYETDHSEVDSGNLFFAACALMETLDQARIEHTALLADAIKLLDQCDNAMEAAHGWLSKDTPPEVEALWSATLHQLREARAKAEKEKL